MLKLQNQKGFTLIELMIVIAIIAILAAIALPAYNNYVAKSQVTEAVSLAASFKAPVSVSLSEDGTCPTGNKIGTGTGKEGNLGQYVKSISFSGENGVCIITATMGTDGVSKKAQNGVIILTSTAPITTGEGSALTDSGVTKWKCTSDKLPNSLLPKSCQTGDFEI